MLSLHQRSGSAQMFSEFVATFGLLAVIWGCSRRRTDIVPFAVAAYITIGILVYGLDFVRESRGHVCPRPDRHVRRHSSTRRPRLRRRAVCRRRGGDAALSDGWCLRFPIPLNTSSCRDPKRHDHECRSLCLRPQRGPFTNGGCVVQQACRSREGARDIRRHRSGLPRHPEVIDAMNEVGVDLSKAGTTRLTTEVAQQAQMLITMGCGDQCPVVRRQARRLATGRPERQSIALVREIRDDIRQRVEACSSTRGGLPPRASQRVFARA